MIYVSMNVYVYRGGTHVAPLYVFMLLYLMDFLCHHATSIPSLCDRVQKSVKALR